MDDKDGVIKSLVSLLSDAMAAEEHFIHLSESLQKRVEELEAELTKEKDSRMK